MVAVVTDQFSHERLITWQLARLELGTALRWVDARPSTVALGFESEGKPADEKGVRTLALPPALQPAGELLAAGAATCAGLIA